MASDGATPLMWDADAIRLLLINLGVEKRVPSLVHVADVERFIAEKLVGLTREPENWGLYLTNAGLAEVKVLTGD